VSDAERHSGETDVVGTEQPAAPDTTPAQDADVDPPLAQDADVAPDADADADAEAAEGSDLVALAEADPRSRVELLAELFEAEARRDEYLDDVRRARAEFENYRRRVMRDGAAQRESGRAEVVEPLLEVLDDLDRTLDAAEGSSDETLAKGVELVATKLVHALRGIGLERIDGIGVGFDPNHHEAVQQQPAEEPGSEPSVVQILRPGYRMGDRVLRAAMVVVEQ
jgi:molecular chaperone GrpE